MKVYDPAERIVYVHLASPARGHDAAPPVLDRLPAGYANQSPRTRVRRDTGSSDLDAALKPVAAVRSGGPHPGPAREAGEHSAIRLA